MPPLPPVALEVISERVGTPGPMPEPTPAPTPAPTPGPGLMSLFICTAAGGRMQLRRVRSSSPAAPRPDARARAFSSFSPGGLFGCGRRASTTGALGSGFGVSGCVAGFASSFGAGLSALGKGGGGSGSRSSSSFASRGGTASTTVRSGSRTGSHGITSATSSETSSTRRRMRLKRSSSSAETDHARIGVCR